jgi:hypothetical protein
MPSGPAIHGYPESTTTPPAALQCGNRVTFGELPEPIIKRMKRSHRCGPSPSVADRDENIGPLNHCDRRLAFGERQIINGLIGDRRHDDGAADVDLHVRRRRALHHSTMVP